MGFFNRKNRAEDWPEIIASMDKAGDYARHTGWLRGIQRMARLAAESGYPDLALQMLHIAARPDGMEIAKMDGAMPLPPIPPEPVDKAIAQAVGGPGTYAMRRSIMDGLPSNFSPPITPEEA